MFYEYGMRTRDFMVIFISILVDFSIFGGRDG